MSPTPQPLTLGSRYMVARTQSYTARAFSTSVRFPRVISRAVSRTMPSVGIRSVGAVHRLSTALSSLAAIVFDQSTARSRARTRLLTSRVGAGPLSANSA